MSTLSRHALAIFLLSATLSLTGCGGNTGPSASSTVATEAPATQPVAQTTGNWPAPVDQTFQGCPAEGDGGDHALNLRKNRIDLGDWQSETVSNIVQLPYPQGVAKQQRAVWSADQAATVAQSEGRPLQIEGYLLLVRHEGPESPNCHDPNARDFHMWLASGPGTSADRASSMIVEVTPRSRALNGNWQPDARLLHLAGKHVRVSGWLLLDQEHPEQVNKTRGTLWEIHPVMKIEVDQNGQWLDLNDPSLLVTGGTSSATTTTKHHRKRTSVTTP